ncbi:LysR family transcriptional regulator [Fertoebacter nigrum]|uniref:LysR family transcriptional regulator n=1 Tax=Fertoeibacter niger TaxID=2656921 RepID=A0A8X8GVB2_9RHOB|nr:LysR family transcriptional regulator [Fertoeibacter niger]NUB45009.1 LysR family transcriptional regulator [Fertoeibacter niger]
MKSDLNRLHMLSVVAKHLNFRRAAAELGMAPGALSERVRDFEQHLGIRVFNRTTRSVALTAAGTALLTEVEPALAKIASAVAAARTSDEVPVGTLRINGPRPALEFRLGPLVTAFLLRHPGMSVEVVADDGFVDVVGRGFDAGVRYGEALEQDMIAVSLGADQRLIVVGAPDYLDRKGRPLEPDGLAGHNCFAQLFPGGNRFGWTFRKAGVEKSITPSGSLACSEPSVQVQAAERGLGLALLFEEHCIEGLAAGRLEQVLADWCPPFPGPYLYYPERRLMPAGLRAFVTFIQAQR